MSNVFKHHRLRTHSKLAHSRSKLLEDASLTAKVKILILMLPNPMKMIKMNVIAQLDGFGSQHFSF